MSEYKVALDVYHGPLELLLFLIHRDEIDIYDIPIAHITQQYLEYIELLQQLDPEQVSEFLVLAATLMEIKSRTLLPRPPVEETDEETMDPRVELVRQLLDYKKFKAAARSLEQAADERAFKYVRSPVLPDLPVDELELDQVDLWDLVDAFMRIMEQIGKTGAVHEIGIDDTPMALHAADIMDSIQRADGTQKFEEVFAGRTKAEMIGLFLALLELIRRRRVRVSQDRPFGTIHVHLVDPAPVDDLDEGDLERMDQPIDVNAQSEPGSGPAQTDSQPVSMVAAGGVSERTANLPFPTEYPDEAQ